MLEQREGKDDLVLGAVDDGLSHVPRILSVEALVHFTACDSHNLWQQGTCVYCSLDLD